MLAVIIMHDVVLAWAEHIQDTRQRAAESDIPATQEFVYKACLRRATLYCTSLWAVIVGLISLYVYVCARDLKHEKTGDAGARGPRRHVRTGSAGTRWAHAILQA